MTSATPIPPAWPSCAITSVTIYERRAVRCDPEQVVITAGTQQAIDIVIRILGGPDKDVWVEDPGYPLTPAALRAAGAPVPPVRANEKGITVKAGKRLAPHA